MWLDLWARSDSPKAFYYSKTWKTHRHTEWLPDPYNWLANIKPNKIFLCMPNVRQQCNLVAASTILETQGPPGISRRSRPPEPPDLHDLQDLRPRPPKIIWTLLFCLGLMCNHSTAWLQPPPYWRLMILGCREGQCDHLDDYCDDFSDDSCDDFLDDSWTILEHFFVFA